MDQYLTSMPTVLILVRNACSYYVCMLSVFVVQLPTLTTKGNVTALNNMVSGTYQCLAIIGDIDTTHTELMNAAMPFFVSL